MHCLLETDLVISFKNKPLPISGWHFKSRAKIRFTITHNACPDDNPNHGSNDFYCSHRPRIEGFLVGRISVFFWRFIVTSRRPPPPNRTHKKEKTLTSSLTQTWKNLCRCGCEEPPITFVQFGTRFFSLSKFKIKIEIRFQNDSTIRLSLFWFFRFFYIPNNALKKIELRNKVRTSNIFLVKKIIFIPSTIGKSCLARRSSAIPSPSLRTV